MPPQASSKNPARAKLHKALVEQERQQNSVSPDPGILMLRSAMAGKMKMPSVSGWHEIQRQMSPFMLGHEREPLAPLMVGPRPGIQRAASFNDASMTPALKSAWGRFKNRFPSAASVISGITPDYDTGNTGDQALLREDNTIRVRRDLSEVDSPELEALLAHEVTHAMFPKPANRANNSERQAMDAEKRLLSVLLNRR